MITIPDVLYVAGNCRIYLQEILKLVKHQRKVVLLPIAQQLLKKLGKRLHTSEYLESKRLLSRLLKLSGQHPFVVF
jgi:hypothetical protein